MNSISDAPRYPWGSDISGRSATRPKDAACTNSNFPPNQKELQSFLDIMNYLGNLLPLSHKGI